MLIEIVGGVLANSLAVITDAAHMLSDVGGFIVSLVALQLSKMEATKEYTYGYKQAEVLGALLSVAIVWALTAVLLWEAIPRFFRPQPVNGQLMFIIAAIGFGVNLILMKVLGHGHSHDDDHGHSHEDESVAVQAALAHVIGDIVQSLGVCVAALCIWFEPFDIGSTPIPDGEVSNWIYADPLCTCMFGVIVLHTTRSTMVRTVETLMGKAPNSINQILVLSVLQLMRLTIKAIAIVKRAGIGHSTFQMEARHVFSRQVKALNTFLARR
ncbi:Slc30a2 [Symbiodinium natans]|uniref:Slc30a2 protein n=1 Tax=Symbiodinium natans TaxID=878477 RepID=A0A812PGB0_9DINO|nr:Slc30a2 [Symbiodinium natans]